MIIPIYDMHAELMVYCYLIMIPQWSLSWAIQSGSHFSIFRCHHASSFFRDTLLVFGSNLAMDMDDWDYTFDDG